jgi:cytochrome c oxidase subunit II
MARTISQSRSDRANVADAHRTGGRMTRRPRRPSSRRWLVGALALPLLLAACAPDAPLDTLQPAGPESRTIHNLFVPVILVAGVVFVLVQGAVLYLAWRFRRHDGDDELPDQIHGNNKLEIGWTILPAVVLAFIGVATVSTIIRLADQPEGALEVQVIGQQWWWEFRYDLDGDGEFDEIVTASDLVLPAGEPVNLSITARDVIHSFWIPALNGKKDAVPGRLHPLTIEADEAGVYMGQCTEFCGLSHAYMQMRVVALERDEWESWAENQQQPQGAVDGLAAEGQEIFDVRCSACHLVSGHNDDSYSVEGVEEALVAGAAPNLTHFATRGVFAGAIFDLWRDLDGDGMIGPDEIGQELNTPDLEAWLRNPPGMKAMAAEDRRGMPNLGLSEEEIDALVAYLVTLD